jgi:hypothetical protein
MEPSPATMDMGLLIVIVTKIAKIKKCRCTESSVKVWLILYLFIPNKKQELLNLLAERVKLLGKNKP